jgi:hypothetical protein
VVVAAGGYCPGSCRSRLVTGQVGHWSDWSLVRLVTGQTGTCAFLFAVVVDAALRLVAPSVGQAVSLAGRQCARPGPVCQAERSVRLKPALTRRLVWPKSGRQTGAALGPARCAGDAVAPPPLHTVPRQHPPQATPSPVNTLPTVGSRQECLARQSCRPVRWLAQTRDGSARLPVRLPMWLGEACKSGLVLMASGRRVTAARRPVRTS